VRTRSLVFENRRSRAHIFPYHPVPGSKKGEPNLFHTGKTKGSPLRCWKRSILARGYSVSVVGVGGLHRLITRVQREKKRQKGTQDNSGGAAGVVAKESRVEEEQHEQ